MARQATSVVAMLAALALTALGWGARQPDAVSDASAGRCTKADAVAAVERLGLGLSPVTPVYKVLCGSFTGPGSKTMVASLLGPENVGMLYWTVFHLSGGEWKLVLKRRQAAVLTASGGDIKETVGVYGAGDPRCCPSGSKWRLWHWNGSRLAAGSWKTTPAATTGGGTSGYFKTPSRNIVCGHTVYSGSRARESFVGCRIKTGLKPEPPGTPSGCWTTGDVLLRTAGRTVTGRVICPGDPEGDAGIFVYESRARVLRYGRTWSDGGLRCASATTGLTCRNREGHGFFLSRERWRSF